MLCGILDGEQPDAKEFIDFLERDPIKGEEIEAYKDYLDRISEPSKPEKLTAKEIEQLRKEGKI